MNKRVKNNFKEYRQFFVLVAFLVVFPLIFFPKSMGLKLNPILLFGCEFIWYLVVYVLLFPFLSFSLVLLYSLFSLFIRAMIGLVFGFLISFMFFFNLALALKLGMMIYLPSIFFQIVLLPFIFKFSFGEKIFKLERERKLDQAKPLQTAEEETIPQHSKAEVQESNLENALSYLKEYSGVEGAFLVDSEGLIVGEDSREGLDAEKIAPLVLSLEETNSNILQKLGESRVERIQFFTENRWITLNRILNFTLVTIASRVTDELLNIRIIKSVEMIKRFLKERYNKLLGIEEGSNVSDLRRVK